MKSLRNLVSTLAVALALLVGFAIPTAAGAEGPGWHVNGSEIEVEEVKGSGNLTFFPHYSVLNYIHCSNVNLEGLIANLEEGPFAMSTSVKLPYDCSANVGGLACTASGATSVTEEAPWYMLDTPEQPTITFTFTEKSCNPAVNMGGKPVVITGTLAGEWSNKNHAIVFDKTKGLKMVGASYDTEVSGTLPMETTTGGVVTVE